MSEGGHKGAPLWHPLAVDRGFMAYHTHYARARAPMSKTRKKYRKDAYSVRYYAIRPGWPLASQVHWQQTEKNKSTGSLLPVLCSVLAVPCLAFSMDIISLKRQVVNSFHTAFSKKAACTDFSCVILQFDDVCRHFAFGVVYAFIYGLNAAVTV